MEDGEPGTDTYLLENHWATPITQLRRWYNRRPSVGLSQGHILLEKLTIKPISGQDSYLTSLKLPIISGNGGYCYMDYHLSLLHILES